MQKHYLPISIYIHCCGEARVETDRKGLQQMSVSNCIYDQLLNAEMSKHKVHEVDIVCLASHVTPLVAGTWTETH